MYIIKSHNWDIPNTDPVLIPVAEMVRKEGVVIIRYTFHGSNWREPASKERFELRFKKEHRNYVETYARYGLATEDEQSIREQTLQVRNNLRIHRCGSGQVTPIDSLLLGWDGDSIVVRCNSNNGVMPKGMEKGAGNRLINTPPLFTHQRRSIKPLSAQQAQIPVPSAPARRHGDY